MEIAGKVAVITGGASGIGRGIGRALASRSRSIADVLFDPALDRLLGSPRLGGFLLGCV